MNRLSNLLQFIIGFFLGVFLLAGGAVALAYAFSRMSGSPPKPLFVEEKKEQAANKQTTASQSANPSTTSTTDENLPPGAYKGRVNWADGLSVRAEPNAESQRLGGVEYKTELIILGTSDDGKWQKIRRSEGTLEGWIKAGNVDKVQ